MASLESSSSAWAINGRMFFLIPLRSNPSKTITVPSIRGGEKGRVYPKRGRNLLEIPTHHHPVVLLADCFFRYIHQPGDSLCSFFCLESDDVLTVEVFT